MSSNQPPRTKGNLNDGACKARAPRTGYSPGRASRTVVGAFAPGRQWVGADDWGIGNDELDHYRRRRQECLESILADPAARKLIVAGPGCGKTHAFREVLRRVEGPKLALTFLLVLVRDLSKSLDGVADVCSFHGLAKHLLHLRGADGLTTHFDFYPALKQIFETDLALTLGHQPERTPEDVLMHLLEDDPAMPAILRSGNYYDAVGYTDSVYRVLRTLETRPDAIPRYAQVVVDEYQDFSLLEASLIDVLASVSPTLVVGDDDQALYLFKHASASYIRQLAEDERYKRFSLPFCSRCTSVLVEATHRVVAKAREAELLADRLDKEYVCFLPDKATDSARYPNIIHAHCSVQSSKAPYMARYIAGRLLEIPAVDVAASRAGLHPTVMIIGPTHVTGPIYNFLRDAYPRMVYSRSTPLQVKPLDGFRRLARDHRSRLGWRILLELHGPDGWQDWVRSALLEGAELAASIEPTYRDRQVEVSAMLRRLVEGDELDEAQQTALVAATGMSSREIAAELGAGEDEIEEVEAPPEAPDDAPSILVTSLVGAKGLQAEHVFVVGVNEPFFPARRPPRDEEVCQLIVALTRACKSCTLVSSDRFGAGWTRRSIFTEWLEPLLATIRVDKAFFGR